MQWNHIPYLSLLIWLPVLGAIGALACREHRLHVARWVGLTTAVTCLLICVPLYMQFDVNTADMQFVEHLNWIPFYDIRYDLGVDGISLPLIMLTCFTGIIVILASWELVTQKITQYLAAFLVMQGMVIGVFAAVDSMLFYFFWEGMLIPMYLSIGIWGSQNRSYAAIKFFLYTFLGSALLLVVVLYLRAQAGSFSILDFYNLKLGFPVQILIFVGFLLAFGIKVPMWPVHTWLPDAHTEAPAGGSVVLAALMLKLGAYGFLRFALPIVPDACDYFHWPMIVLSLIGIVYIGFIAFAQTDMKRLIAYSSVAHMGFVTLGCFMVFVIMKNTGNVQNAYMSLEGGMVQMITHAFGSGAMFLAFGMIYHRLHTRAIDQFGGIAQTMPMLAAFFMVFVLTNVGVPGTSGFVGEFMVIMSGFRADIWVAIIAALSLIVGAVYSLWMYKRVFYGAIASPQVAALKDISLLDKLMFSMLVGAILFFGISPNPLLNVMHASVGRLLGLTLRMHY